MCSCVLCRVQDVQDRQPQLNFPLHLVLSKYSFMIGIRSCSCCINRYMSFELSGMQLRDNSGNSYNTFIILCRLLHFAHDSGTCNIK